MSCNNPSITGNHPPSYSVSKLSTQQAPRSQNDLERWLDANSPNKQWIGKIYVASTIAWNGRDFLQGGCSPNYRAGWWSLTSCKHEMRSAQPLNNALKGGNEAVFMFTLAEQDQGGRQNLVSVAKVTKHFATMPDYARHLLGSGNSRLISSRLTRRRRNDGEFGWRFGDCHSDRWGTVAAPYPDHVHGINYAHCWSADNTLGHTLLMSGCFHIWKAPVFCSAKTIKQSRYGHNINSTNLWKLLK